MSFENILGNDKVKDTLDKALKENRISHSYLFVGIDGIGKKLFAKEFARRLLCLEQEKEESLEEELKKSIKQIEKEIEKLEIDTLLSGKYDINNAIITIHPGARRDRKL